MKPKFTEYERRQIQAMMRKQMPWRKNLVLGSDNLIKWDCGGERLDMWFDSEGLAATACKRWCAESFPADAENEIYRSIKRKSVTKRVDQWRYDSNIVYIQVTDQLNGKQRMLVNTLPDGMQVMDLLDALETEFKMSAQEMDELLHIVGGWSPNAWNVRVWGERYNRMKALWRMTAAIVGQFSMVLKGYDIFKAHGFDGHFVGFKEK